MNMDLTKREKELILFIREFKFGKVELVIHAGEPKKIIIKERIKFLGEGLTEHREGLTIK